MAIPDGYVALALVGFTDRGTYDSTATYMTNDLVHDTYNNIWKCLQDNTSNVAPTAGAYWKLFMGASDSLTGMTATDTSGVLGSAGQVVVAQALVDAIANKVMNELVSKSQIINNLLATIAGNALDAVQGKILNDKIVQANSDLVKIKTYSASLVGAVTGDNVYSFDVSSISGNILAYIPVIQYGGNTHITCRIGSIASVNAITVRVNSERELTYGNIVLYVLYK